MLLARRWGRASGTFIPLYLWVEIRQQRAQCIVGMAKEAY